MIRSASITRPRKHFLLAKPIKEERVSEEIRFVFESKPKEKSNMYTNPFNRKHSTIRQMLDKILDPTKRSIRRSESVSSSDSGSSKGSNSSLTRCTHSHRGVLHWGRKWTTEEDNQWNAVILFFLSVFAFLFHPLCVSSRESKPIREVINSARDFDRVCWQYQQSMPWKILLHGIKGRLATTPSPRRRRVLNQRGNLRRDLMKIRSHISTGETRCYYTALRRAAPRRRVVKIDRGYLLGSMIKGYRTSHGYSNVR